MNNEKLKHTGAPDCPACAAQREEREEAAKRRKALSEEERAALMEKVKNADYNKELEAIHFETAARLKDLGEKYSKVSFVTVFAAMPVNEETELIGGSPLCMLLNGDTDKIERLLEDVESELSPRPEDLFKMLGDALKGMHEKKGPLSGGKGGRA